MMNKKLLLVLIFAFIASFKLTAQTTYVPDAIFEAYLETHDAGGNIVAVGSSNSLGNGVSNDHYVDTAGVSTVTALYIYNLGIEDLTGIEDFTALTTLFCYGNQLTNLNVSSLTNLDNLQCSDNQLTSLNISGCTNLTVLNCGSNSLTSLDVSNNYNLEGLYCSFNQLTGLDVSYNTALITLDCHSNNLTSLDLHQNTSLNSIDLSSNSLTEVDIDNGANPAGYFSALGQGGTLSCIQVTNPSYYNTNWSANIDSGTSFNINCHYNETYVPDAIFEAYLETHDYNGNVVAVGSSNSMGNGVSNDQYVSTSQISSVTELSISNLGISDLTGIQDFTSLQTLNCMLNSLTTLDLNSNTNLINLNCSNNQLTSLTTSNFTSLVSLVCNINAITSLHLVNNTALETVICDYNQLVYLNIQNGNNTNITNFNIRDNANLTCVQVDDVAWSTANWTNKDAQTNYSTDCTAAVSENELSKIKVYPNPLKDVLTVETLTNGILTIVNEQGQELINTKITNGKNTVGVSKLAKGVYFAKIKTNATTQIIKLIK